MLSKLTAYKTLNNGHFIDVFHISSILSGTTDSSFVKLSTKITKVGGRNVHLCATVAGVKENVSSDPGLDFRMSANSKEMRVTITTHKGDVFKCPSLFNLHSVNYFKNSF